MDKCKWCRWVYNSMQKLCSVFSLDAVCIRIGACDADCYERRMWLLQTGSTERSESFVPTVCVCHTVCTYTEVLMMRLPRYRACSVRILRASLDLSDNASTSPRHIHIRNPHLIPAPRTRAYMEGMDTCSSWVFVRRRNQTPCTHKAWRALTFGSFIAWDSVGVGYGAWSTDRSVLKMGRVGASGRLLRVWHLGRGSRSVCGVGGVRFCKTGHGIEIGVAVGMGLT
jgi:hypothetical protein